jgi:hypothetical protein
VMLILSQLSRVLWNDNDAGLVVMLV